MKLFPLIALLLLAGCSKEDKPAASLGGQIGFHDTLIATQTPEIRAITVLVGGQSNADTIRGLPADLGASLSAMGYQPQIIATAVGGSTQAEWSPFGGHLYAAALQQCVGRKVDALVWWQGEASAMNGNMADAQVWAANFTEMVNAFRRDLNRPDLPIVFIQLGVNPGGDTPAPGVQAAWEEVKRQQASVSMRGVTMVRSDDLSGCWNGWVHMTSPSCYETMAQRITNLIK